MEFKKQGFVVICKEPEECEGYFAKDDYSTCDISEADIFNTKEEVEEYISEYDDPELYTYKPIEITYRIKNLKLL